MAFRLGGIRTLTASDARTTSQNTIRAAFARAERKFAQSKPLPSGPPQEENALVEELESLRARRRAALHTVHARFGLSLSADIVAKIKELGATAARLRRTSPNEFMLSLRKLDGDKSVDLGSITIRVTRVDTPAGVKKGPPRPAPKAAVKTSSGEVQLIVPAGRIPVRLRNPEGLDQGQWHRQFLRNRRALTRPTARRVAATPRLSIELRPERKDKR